jgi:hypothetical protein
MQAQSASLPHTALALLPTLASSFTQIAPGCSSCGSPARSGRRESEAAKIGYRRKAEEHGGPAEVRATDRYCQRQNHAGLSSNLLQYLADFVYIQVTHKVTMRGVSNEFIPAELGFLHTFTLNFKVI